MAKSLARILVTGSRHLGAEHINVVGLALGGACQYLGALPREATIVHGAAPGADSLARHWAETSGARHEPHPADWNTDGKAAGPIRNSYMVTQGAHICVAFYDGKKERSGTRDCFEKAIAAGIPTIVVPVKVKPREEVK